MSNIEKTKEILEKEYNENCKKINELSEKIRTIKATDFETKLTRTFAFSMIPWGAIILLLPTIMNSGIPINLISPLSIGVPALIGIIGEKLLTKKFKYQENLEAISKSKSQKEKIEESTKYEIEREKLRSSNKVLKKAYDKLESESKLSNDNIKEIDSSSYEDQKLNIEKIDEILKQKQKKIDIITTKSVLKEKFGQIRDRFQKVIDFIVIATLGGVGFMTIYNMPIMAINLKNNIQLPTTILGLIAPLGIGGLVCGSYYLKRIKDHNDAFKNVNKELGQELLSDGEIIKKSYNNDIENFELELENLINDACDIKLQLESEKQKLDNNELVCDKNIKKGESYENLLELPMKEVSGPRLVKTKTSSNDKTNK